MTANNLGGSMDDYPLTLTTLIDHAARLYADRKVLSRRLSGMAARVTLGSCAGAIKGIYGNEAAEAMWSPGAGGTVRADDAAILARTGRTLWNLGGAGSVTLSGPSCRWTPSRPA